MLPTPSFFMAIPSLKALCSHNRGMLPSRLAERASLTVSLADAVTRAAQANREAANLIIFHD
jgi:hypothetical protein